MKNRIAIILTALACLFLICGSATAAPMFERPRLAVREFQNKTDGRVPTAAITEMMTTELFKTGLFNLVERERLDYIADEIRLGQSGLVDQSTAPEVGRIKGAEYTITGAVTLYYYNSGGGVVYLHGVAGGLLSRTAYVTLDIRIIDNTTSEVVYAAVEQGASNQTIGGAATAYGAFGGGKTGGILAAATRAAVVKHAKTMKEIFY
ncbi:MAG: CsgG/HfaB family protein [Synergistaceae bacterium]|nr:CsgG/HfaB family protein [Synergistaceae bacterium]